MTSFGIRLVSSVVEAAMWTPLAITGGAFYGYVYSKLAHFATQQSMEAWAIWFVAENTFQTLASSVSENPTNKVFIKATLIIASTAFAIQEMQEKGLIGFPMTIFIIAIRAFTILQLVASTVPAMPAIQIRRKT